MQVTDTDFNATGARIDRAYSLVDIMEEFVLGGTSSVSRNYRHFHLFLIIIQVHFDHRIFYRIVGRTVLRQARRIRPLS